MKPVIFLDLDETLVRQERAFRLAFLETARFLVKELDAEQMPAELLAENIPGAAQQALQLSPMADTIRSWRFGGRDLLWGDPGQTSDPLVGDSLDRFRIESWKIVLAKAGAAGPGTAHLPGALQTRFRQSMRDHISLFPGAMSAVKEMADEFRLAIITNGMELAQKQKLELLGLGPFFEQLIASATVGVGKPDTKIFRYALEVMDCPASDAFMIGDALEADIQAAMRCGINACWLNRSARQASNFQPQIFGIGQWRKALGQWRNALEHYS